MTTLEMSNLFDILYNNVMSNSAPGLSEYEKSVFLTKAQEEIVRSIYNNTFEGTEEMRRCIDVLITDKRIEPSDDEELLPFPYTRCCHAVFTLPTNIMYIIIESAQYDKNANTCWAGKWVPVSPTLYDDLHKDLRNPFRGATETKVLRIDTSATAENNSQVELLSKYDISLYAIRYLRKPKPIILEELEDELSLEGESEVSNYGGEACELNKMIHHLLVERAVQLAKAAYTGR